MLVENSGQTLEKEELLQKVWPDTFVDEGNLSQNISVLRKALGDNAADTRYIETIPRRGYRFIAEVRESEGHPVEVPPARAGRRDFGGGSNRGRGVSLDAETDSNGRTPYRSGPWPYFRSRLFNPAWKRTSWGWALPTA